MFTGLIQQIAEVVDVDMQQAYSELTIQSAYNDLLLGESIAVNGACLTVSHILDQGAFVVQISKETLQKTKKLEHTSFL